MLKGQARVRFAIASSLLRQRLFMSTNTILIIVVLILLFGGGWGYSRRGR